MAFNIISPVAMTIDAPTFVDAVKKYVRMNQEMKIEQIIVADQMKKHMMANVKYYTKNRRNKFHAKLYPYQPPIMAPILTPMPMPIPQPIIVPTIVKKPQVKSNGTEFPSNTIIKAKTHFPSGTIITNEINLMNCINLTHLTLNTSCIKPTSGMR